MQFNGGDWETYAQITALCIGNAKYFGGGMKIAPNADPHSGNFEVHIVVRFSLRFFLSGTVLWSLDLITCLNFPLYVLHR